MSEIDDAIRYFMEDVEDCENAIKSIKDTLKISEYEKEEIDALRTHADESRMLVSWLKELKDYKKHKWIPVSERLPEEYKRVIVSDVFGIYIGEFVDAEENWGGKHFINEHGMHSKSVVAWMPLPEPYKQEAEDEN